MSLHGGGLNSYRAVGVKTVHKRHSFWTKATWPASPGPKRLLGGGWGSLKELGIFVVPTRLVFDAWGCKDVWLNGAAVGLRWCCGDELADAFRTRNGLLQSWLQGVKSYCMQPATSSFLFVMDYMRFSFSVCSCCLTNPSRAGCEPLQIFCQLLKRHSL